MGVDTLGTSTTHRGKKKKISNKKLTPLHDHDYDEELMEDNMFHLIFERAVCDASQLSSRHSPFNLTLKQRIRLIHHVLCALEWMHDHHMLHRDIKVENLLVFGDDPDKLTMKVADLGMVRNHVRVLATSPTAYTTKDRPPEVAFRCDKYHFQADTWAAGVSFFYILTGEMLFDPGDEDEDVLILEEILRRHEDLFKDVREFKDLYKRYGIRLGENPKLPYRKPVSYGSLSNNLTRGNKYVNIEDRLLDIYIDEGEPISFIRRVSAFVRDCLVLDPSMRPSPSVVLNRYADLFSECDPNAPEERRKSRAFENENSDIHWRGGITTDKELTAKSMEELKQIVEHARDVFKDSKLCISRDPRVIIHALETYERFLAWRDYTDECQKKSDDDLAMLRVFDLNPRIIFYYLCYMHYKQFIPLEYIDLSTFMDELSELFGKEEYNYSSESLYSLEKYIIANFYSYGTFVPTLFEGSDQWFMGNKTFYDPFNLTTYLLEHYFELHGSPEKLVPLLIDYKTSQ